MPAENRLEDAEDNSDPTEVFHVARKGSTRSMSLLAAKSS